VSIAAGKDWSSLLREPVADLLRNARQRSGMTQAQVARATGIDPSVVSKYELGTRQPSATALLKIAHAIGMDLRGRASEQDGDCERAADPRTHLRVRVLKHLTSQGFRITAGGAIAPVESDKGKIRQLHTESVHASRERARPTLTGIEPKLLRRLANGAEVRPAEIDPRLVLVENRRSEDGYLWRWCSLHWSIPVSGGYGRRLRFLVIDKAHDDAVMGIIGLGDPVFALGARDKTIGWTAEQRTRRLTCVMDAFVLGAVPPYDSLLGGKLVAMLAGAREVRRAFATRYGHRQTLIADRDPHAQLALITTISALGRSSIYNRLSRPDGTLALRPAGYTLGSGDFHFSGAIYADLAAFASTLLRDGDQSHRNPRWTGDGFRNRRELIIRALEGLGFDSKIMRMHGVRRQVFLNPLASNTFQWLRGEPGRLDWYPSGTVDLASWWRDRWAVPRSLRDESWMSVQRHDWALYGPRGTKY